MKKASFYHGVIGIIWACILPTNCVLRLLTRRQGIPTCCETVLEPQRSEMLQITIPARALSAVLKVRRMMWSCKGVERPWNGKYQSHREAILLLYMEPKRSVLMFLLPRRTCKKDYWDADLDVRFESCNTQMCKVFVLRPVWKDTRSSACSPKMS